MLWRLVRPNVNNKNGGLHQYGAEPFEQQQLGTAGFEGVNIYLLVYLVIRFIVKKSNDYMIPVFSNLCPVIEIEI